MELILEAKSFIFIRHGETDWNRNNRTMGQTDIPLNNLGITQAHEAKFLFDNCGIERIVHSPLMRAKQTAEIINEHLKLPIETFDDLKECGWGVQEGRLKGSKFTTESWVDGFTPEGGEPYIDFRKRAIQAISDVTKDSAPTLIVAHGGLFWAMMDVLKYRHRRLMNAVPVAFHSPKSAHESWQVISLDPFYEIEI